VILPVHQPVTGPLLALFPGSECLVDGFTQTER